MDSGAIPDRNAAVVAQAVLGVSSILARTQLLGRKRAAAEVASEVVDFCWNGLVGSNGETSARRSA